MWPLFHLNLQNGRFCILHVSQVWGISVKLSAPGEDENTVFIYYYDLVHKGYKQLAECYGLNCVPLPNSYEEALSPSVTVPADGVYLEL